LQYGFEKFCAAAAAAGIDGLILPDLPEHEYETEYGSIIQKYSLDFIFFSYSGNFFFARKKLDSLSSGFLYAVSSSSITGTDKDFSPVKKYLAHLNSLQLTNPLLVGFGIKDHETFTAACSSANGAIIGTAFIQAIEKSTALEKDVAAFIQNIRQ